MIHLVKTSSILQIGTHHNLAQQEYQHNTTRKTKTMCDIYLQLQTYKERSYRSNWRTTCYQYWEHGL